MRTLLKVSFIIIISIGSILLIYCQYFINTANLQYGLSLYRTVNNDNKSILHQLSLTDIQLIINEYVIQLSQQNYSCVKEKILIKNKYIFPHLTTSNMISSLQHHNIWMSGDSTIENVLIFLFQILMDYNLNNNNIYNQHRFFDYNLSLIRPTRLIGQIRPCNAAPLWPMPCDKRYDTMIINITNKIYPIAYRHYNNYSMNISLYGLKYQKCGYYPDSSIINQLPVDIIISNMDLFFCLHLFNPFTDSTRSRFTSQIMLKSLQNDLENKMELFVNNAMNNNKNIKCMIFYGTNFIEENRYYGPWKESAILWNAKNINKTLIDICLNTIKHNKKDILIDLRNTTGFLMTAYQLCTKNTLTSIGSIWISQRMYSWIIWKQKQLDLLYNNKQFKLIYFNQTQITMNRAQYTNDGRHYKPMVPVKTEVILNIISNFCG